MFCNASRLPAYGGTFVGGHFCHLPTAAPLLQKPSPGSYGSRRSVTTQAISTSSTRLRNPARVGGNSSTTIKIEDYGGSVGLDAYMRLPPEQYSALDANLIQSLGGDKFRLCVPRVHLFSEWIEPTVDIRVSGANRGTSKVVLVSESCRLAGSELIKRMQLDQRFVLNFTTELTWTPVPGHNSQEKKSSSSNNSGDSLEQLNMTTSGSITGDLELEVLTEVIAPFHLLPRDVLEGAVNAVLRGLMRQLLPLFMKRLAADYAKWAIDEEYRTMRNNIGKKY